MSGSKIPRPRELEVKRTAQFIGYTDHIWKLISGQLGPQLQGSEG